MSTKRQIQAEETRRRIFAAAQHLINEKGFDAFTMQDVAEAAGVGVGTIYHYYASKDEFVTLYDLMCWKDIYQENDTAFRESQLERLFGFVRKWFELSATDSLPLAKVWYRMGIEHKLRYVREGETQYDIDCEYIADCLRGAVEAGELHPDTPVDELAAEIAFSIHGASFHRCNTLKPFDYVGWGKTYTERILPRLLESYRLHP